MKFQEIHKPIKKELDQVKSDLKNLSSDIPNSSLPEIIEYFFKIPGKHLRPTLVLLSAGTVNSKLSTCSNSSLIQLAVVVELIHSASLIHDDIIDNDFCRRGQKTLNKIYGRKVAVLAGDVIFSHAFSIINESLPKKFVKSIVQLTTEMCAAEIDQAQYNLPNKEMYFNIIKGKTASFMGLCCRLGGEISGGSEKEILILEEYGLNLGMAYQIIDDYMDGDIKAKSNVTMEDAHYFAQKAIDALRNFEASSYKDSLTNLVNYILTFSHSKTQNA
jgi:octaprenyl-diphosphate synthase